MRGDEPELRAEFGETIELFPACAGMNRLICQAIVSPAAVPRMRGDEPNTSSSNRWPPGCSPHARG